MLPRFPFLCTVTLLGRSSFVSCQTQVTDSSTASSTFSAQQTGIACPGNDGADVMVGDEEFEVFCGYNITGLPQLFQYAAIDEQDCLDKCGALPECVGATYNGESCIGFSAPPSGTAIDYTLVGADFVSFQLENSSAVSSSSRLTMTSSSTVSSSFSTSIAARPSSVSTTSIDSSTSNLFSSSITSPSSTRSVEPSSLYSFSSSSFILVPSTDSIKPSSATRPSEPMTLSSSASSNSSPATTSTQSSAQSTSPSSLAETLSTSLSPSSRDFATNVASTPSISLPTALLISTIITTSTATSSSAASMLLPLPPPVGGCPSIRTGRGACVLSSICCDDRSHFSIWYVKDQFPYPTNPVFLGPLLADACCCRMLYDAEATRRPLGKDTLILSVHSITSGNDPQNTSLVYMGSTAAGTHCSTSFSPNRIRADHEGHCAPDGSLLCSDDGNTFMRCVHGGWINFSGVAAGTTCVNGTIVASK